MVSFLPAVAAYAFVGVCFGVACAASNRPCDKGGGAYVGPSLAGSAVSHGIQDTY